MRSIEQLMQARYPRLPPTIFGEQKWNDAKRNEGVDSVE